MSRWKLILLQVMKYSAQQLPQEAAGHVTRMQPGLPLAEHQQALRCGQG